jgi:hypothetical protein
VRIAINDNAQDFDVFSDNTDGSMNPEHLKMVRIMALLQTA